MADYVLDTNAWTHFLQGNSAMVRRVRRHHSRVHLCTPVVAELMHGSPFARAKAPARVATIRALLEAFPVLAFDVPAAETYGARHSLDSMQS